MSNIFKANNVSTNSINLSGLNITSAGASSNKVLYGDGTWNTPPGGAVTYSYLVDVNFGCLVSGQCDCSYTTVSGVSGNWVTNNSIIHCIPMGTQTANHSGEDVVLDGIVAYATNIVSGVSFDVYATAPFGAHGVYKIGIIGQ